MALRLGELVAIISADDSKFHRTLNAVEGRLRSVGKAGQFAALAGAATQFAAALGPAAGGLFSLAAGLGATLAPAAGVAVALPAVALAWKSSMAIMKLATEDLGEALGAAVEGDQKKFEEGLKKLPPAARSVARELGTALSGLKGTVQAAFFRPIAAQTRGLGRQLRGPLQSGMATAAAGLGTIAARAAAVAREGRSIATMRNLFVTIGVTARRASVGVAPLLRGLRAVVDVGLTKIPRIGTAVGGVATAMGRWLERFAESGRASRVFDRALRVIRQLGRIARNVGVTIGAVFGAAASGAGNMLNPVERVTGALAKWSTSARGRAALLDFFYRGRQSLNQLARIAGNLGRALGGVFNQASTGSNDFLGNLERISARLADWVNSAEGQKQLGQTFAMLKQVTSDLMTILPGLAVVLGQVAGFITSLPAPVRGAVSQMLAWAVVIGLVSSKFGPLILGIGKTIGFVGRIGRSFTSAGGAGRRFMGRMGTVFSSIARGARTAALWVGRMALQIGRAALSVVASGLRMAGTMALAAARVVGGWILMGVQALLNAAKVAAAWLISMGPIGLVVAAAIAAVVLIIKYWDEIVDFFVKTLPHWLKVGLDFAVGIIKKAASVGFFGPVGLILTHWDKVSKFFSKTLPHWLKVGLDFVVNLIKKAAQFGFLGPIGLIISHWGRISKFFTQTLPKAVGSGINNVIGWLRRLPGWVVNAVGNTGKLLVNAGKNIMIGLWNGLVSMASWLQRSLVNLVRQIIPGPVARVLGIASPSKVFAGFGENLAQGLALGMTDNAGLVADASKALAGAAATGGASGLAASRVGRPAAASGGAGGGGVARVELDFTGADAEFAKLFRKLVRVKGRGDVQVLVARRA